MHSASTVRPGNQHAARNRTADQNWLSPNPSRPEDAIRSTCRCDFYGRTRGLATLSRGSRPSEDTGHRTAWSTRPTASWPKGGVHIWMDATTLLCCLRNTMRHLLD